MDENGLPITGAGVNYSAVEAISQRELVTYFNMFLARTCTFLNTFSTTCESKLSNLHTRFETIDTNLVLLETKLNSVEELKDVKLEIAQPQDNPQTVAPAAPLPPPPQALNSDQVNVTAATVTEGQLPPPPPPAPAIEDQEPVMTVCQNPKYKKYFSMLKMGVVEEAVRIKMRTEGVDPDLLSTPNAPAPYIEESSSSSDSDSD